MCFKIILNFTRIMQKFLEMNIIILFFLQSEATDMSTKLVYDRNDPNRPRFTLTELKDILYQRNELKARVSDLEDELSVFRPAKQQQYVIVPSCLWQHEHASLSRVSGCKCDLCAKNISFSSSSASSRENLSPPPLEVWEDYCCSTLNQGMCWACGAIAAPHGIPPRHASPTSLRNSPPENTNSPPENNCQINSYSAADDFKPSIADAILAEIRASFRDADVLSAILKNELLSAALLPAVRGLDASCGKCDGHGKLMPMDGVDWAPLFRAHNRPHDTFVKNLSQFVEVKEVSSLVDVNKKRSAHGNNIAPDDMQQRPLDLIIMDDKAVAPLENNNNNKTNSPAGLGKNYFAELHGRQGPKLECRDSVTERLESLCQNQTQDFSDATDRHLDEGIESVDCCNKFNSPVRMSPYLPISESPSSCMPSFTHPRNFKHVPFSPYLLSSSPQSPPYFSSSPSQFAFISSPTHPFPSSGEPPKLSLPSLLCINCVDLNFVSAYLTGSAKSKLDDSRDESLSSGVSSDSAVDVGGSSASSSCLSGSHCRRGSSELLERLFGGIGAQMGVLRAVGDSAVLLVTLQLLYSLLVFVVKLVFGRGLPQCS